MEQQYAPASSQVGEAGAGFPLSSAQRGIWFAQHLLGDIPLTIAQYVDVRGHFDPEIFADAGAATARELGTGMLRIFEVDGHPHQVIDHTLEDRATILDLRDEDDPEAAALAWMRAEYRTPLDMLEDRLIVCAVLRIADDRHFVYTRIHHIALDGYGATTFDTRTAERYSAAVQHREPARFDVSPLPEIVEDEQRYRDSARFESDRAYWADRIRDLPHPISLAGRAAPVGPHPVRFSAPLPERVEAAVDRMIAEREKTTTFATVVAAAFAAFLARVTGETDVVLSLPVSARTTVRLRRSGGMVSNVVPIRVAVEPDGSRDDLIDRMQLEFTGALRHQRYRHEDMRRDTGYGSADRGFFGPAVNVMMFDHEIRYGDSVGRRHVLSTGPVDDLSLNIYPSAPGQPAHIDLEANPHLYTVDELRSHHTRFVEYLGEFADSDRTIGTLPVLHDDEYESLVPYRGLPAQPVRLFADFLADGVRRNPDGVAIVDGDRQVIYRELDDLSNRLAAQLVEAGAAPETFVALSMDRGADALIAVWAVAKTGAAFVPIDPALPADRIAYMVGDSGAQLGLTVRSRMAELPTGPRWIAVDDPLPSDADVEVVRSRAVPENPAYMIYTSGSTGTPKGVVVSHLGLATFAADARPELALGTDSRMLRFSSASFDASIFEMLQAFSAGAAMVVAPPHVLGGDELVDVLRTHRVTHIVSAPTVLNTVDPAGLPDLEAVVVGGDVCTADLVERFAPTCRFTNSYGPTETTIVVTAGDPLALGDPITIGRPLDGVVAVVLDRRLRPVPVGFVGELYLGGPALARGYHRRPGQTADRFVANPLEPGTRLYRTGDEVRWTPDHQLDFVGRSDFQVKIRGFRIELGEINNALLDQDGVDFATTVVHDSGSSVVPVSYVRMESGAAFDMQALLDGVARVLPSHMVPAAVVELTEIPVTPAGKLDRAALPAPQFATAEFRAPETESERLLAEVATGLLDVERIGVDDSLFALGADSIVAMQFAARAKTAGLHITARQIFEHKTIAALARVATAVPTALVLDELPGGGVGDIPITPIVHEMLGRGDYSTFAQAVLVSTPADLTYDDLRAALSAVVARHDILRSTLRDGQWRTHAELPDLDAWITRVPVADTASADAYVDDECDAAAHDLDPESGLVLRAVWFDVAEPGEQGRLLLVAHHLVVDGVSWRVLLPDLGQAWMQVAAGQTPSLPEVGTSYRRWAHVLHDTARDHAGELDHWTETLGGAAPLAGVAPLDPEIDTLATTATVRIDLDPSATDAVLTRLPELYGSGTADGLLTALALAAAQGGQRSLLLTLEGHGRDLDATGTVDLARTVGWFTSAYPVRLDLADDLDLTDATSGGRASATAIKTVKERLAAVPNNGAGYGILRHLDAQTAPVLAALPTAQVSFNYLGRLTSGHIADEIREIGWVPLDLDLDPNRTSQMAASVAVDINAMVVDGPDGAHLTASFTYVPRVISAETVGALAERWKDALVGLAAHTQRPDAGGLTPSDVPLVRTHQQQIEQWENRFGRLADIWPLSPLQTGLAFHAALSVDAVDVYTAQLRLDLAGDVDAGRWQAAFASLLARHAALRTAFVHDDTGTPVQLVLDHVEMPWREVDLTGSSDPHSDLQALLDTERFTRFDLASPPLLRAVLVRLPEQRAVLALTNHHIVLDGWSMPLLVRELLVGYAAGGQAALPTPASYRDYLAWLDRQDTDRALDAWAEAFADLDEPTLVAPGATDAVDDAPVQIDIDLDADDIDALARLSRRTGATLNTIVQTAWGLLLARHWGARDAVFGATVSGRPADLPDVENMLGLFINTLPVRVRIDDTETVADLVLRLQGEQTALLDQQFVGLGAIQDRIGAGTLFDTLTVFESYPVDRAGFDENTDIAGMHVIDVDARDATHYPLSLMALLEPHLRLSLRYRTDVFDAATVDDLARRFTQILKFVAGRPDEAVGAVDVFLPGERERVLGSWNHTAHPVPAGDVVALFEQQVARTPDAPAVVVDRSVSTYAEFASDVHRLARRLLAEDVAAETRVAVAVPRSYEQLVAIYAVLAAGGVYVPVDPDQPAQRTAHVLTTAAPQLVLATDETRDSLPADLRVLDVSDVDGYSGDPLTDDERPELRPGNLAYVLFTSGSTGRPKGVAVTHGALHNQLAWMRAAFAPDAADTVLYKTPFTFDASVWELFLPLQSGSRLVIADRDGHADPAYLASVVHRERVTMAQFVPSVLDLFVAEAQHAGIDASSLRAVFSGGEALRATTADRVREVLGAEVHNLYGPTETTVQVAHRTAMVQVAHRTARRDDLEQVPL
ncbi:MAG: amino acid adenylation domain-containing protein, partial [Rhodococcus sp. (in: high G+C Gram-positive bacteria)]